MLDKAKQACAELKRGRPGKRFQQRYRRRNPSGRRSGGKVATLLVGAALFAAGLILLAVPGPGIPLVALGAALIAEESLVGARVADWCEVEIRALLAQARRVWRGAGIRARAAIVLAAVVLAGAGAYGAWWMTFGR